MVGLIGRQTKGMRKKDDNKHIEELDNIIIEYRNTKWSTIDKVISRVFASVLLVSILYIVYYLFHRGYFIWPF